MPSCQPIASYCSLRILTNCCKLYLVIIGLDFKRLKHCCRIDIYLSSMEEEINNVFWLRDAAGTLSRGAKRRTAVNIAPTDIRVQSALSKLGTYTFNAMCILTNTLELLRCSQHTKTLSA